MGLQSYGFNYLQLYGLLHHMTCDGEGQLQYDRIIHIRQGTSIPVKEGAASWTVSNSSGIQFLRHTCLSNQCDGHAAMHAVLEQKQRNLSSQLLLTIMTITMLDLSPSGMHSFGWVRILLSVLKGFMWTWTSES